MVRQKIDVQGTEVALMMRSHRHAIKERLVPRELTRQQITVVYA